MKVFLTGGTGFIGSALVARLAARGDQCTVLSRRGHHVWPGMTVRVITGDPAVAGAWQDEVDGVDAVVSLAGEKLVDPPKRWTRTRKRELWDSRVRATEILCHAIQRAQSPPKVWLSASGIDYYGGRGDEPLDETAGPGDDFLARLCTAWESAAVADGTRVTYLRTGPVLGPGGGALAPMLPIFRLGLGGPWGHGEQRWSWIHLDDHIGLMQLALDRELSGPLNLTGPNPVTVNEFAKALGAALGRPAVMRVPRMAMQLALGEAASVLFDLQWVVPKRALAAGYRFQYPEISGALRQIVG